MNTEFPPLVIPQFEYDIVVAEMRDHDHISNLSARQAITDDLSIMISEYAPEGADIDVVFKAQGEYFAQATDGNTYKLVKDQE